MNIKEYIESGIIEAYVLGALPEQESAQVEADIAMYPELAAEKLAIEEAMANFAGEFAAEPPAAMQEQIWDALKDEEDAADTPIRSIPMPADGGGGASGNGRVSWQRAAVWAAVIVSVLTNFVLLSQRNESREKQNELATRVDSMQQSQQELVASLNAYKQERDIALAPGMETVVMRKEGEQDMAGMVYWSKDKGEAYLALHNMPLPPQGKQYQLWVIQDGKPVDMGVISNDLVSGDGMLKLSKAVSSGQAFAISLEKEGGNPTPTEVYMVGATS